MQSSIEGARKLLFRQDHDFLVVEELGLLIAVQVFGVDRYQIFFLKGAFAAKIVLAFAAVLVNYILSKFLIFKKTEEKRKEF